MKLKIYSILGLLTVFLISCNTVKQTKMEDSFSIVFMTDIHLQPELNAPEGFKQAIDTINSLKPDFVIAGGDLIMDALGQSYERSDSLYNMYVEMIKNLNMPVYNTMGNHEIYGLYIRDEAVENDPEYGEKMFEKRLGKSYYSFEHKGWKFYILNSIDDTGRKSYYGWVDSTQLSWIKEDLAKTDTTTPIFISTHIPFITAFKQKYYGSTLMNDSSLVVANSKEVLDLFTNHNLKLVYQGHLHTCEDISIDGIHFITGGAVCGAWWKGPNMSFEEGFSKITFTKNAFTTKYIDYGWTIKK